MTTTHKWIALFVLLSGASINMYIKNFNKADGFFLFSGISGFSIIFTRVFLERCFLAHLVLIQHQKKIENI
jgi:hypothetical protein